MVLSAILAAVMDLAARFARAAPAASLSLVTFNAFILVVVTESVASFESAMIPSVICVALNIFTRLALAFLVLLAAIGSSTSTITN